MTLQQAKARYDSAQDEYLAERKSYYGPAWCQAYRDEAYDLFRDMEKLARETVDYVYRAWLLSAGDRKEILDQVHDVMSDQLTEGRDEPAAAGIFQAALQVEIEQRKEIEG